MKKIKTLSVLFLALLIFITNAQAQTENSPAAKDNAVRISVKPISYSAEAISERIQNLNNGNKIKSTTRELIYADSKGRIRRETEIISGNRIQKSINIRDISADVDYYLNPATKTAYKTQIKTFSPAAQKSFSIPDGYSTTSDSLGKKNIEGFEAEGRRSITTIAAGTIGNEQPLMIISENWFSPELRTIILSRRSDPQTGDYSFEMKNIKREEPDSTLFSIPPDYKIVDSVNVSDRFFTVDGEI